MHVSVFLNAYGYYVVVMEMPPVAVQDARFTNVQRNIEQMCKGGLAKYPCELVTLTVL